MITILLIYLVKIKFKNETIKDDSIEISNSGGLIEFLRRKHAIFGEIIIFYLGKGNKIVSINNPNLIKSTLKFGSRPKALFEFLTPLIGKDNLQIFSAERAAQFRRLVSGCLGAESSFNFFYLNST